MQAHSPAASSFDWSEGQDTASRTRHHSPNFPLLGVRGRSYTGGVLTQLTEQLRRRESLSADQVKLAIAGLVDPQIAVECKADFLVAMAQKGESLEELRGFAHELRARSIPVPLDEHTQGEVIIDLCGTGGDRLGTFNISTTVALMVSAAGVKVAKHGNRAITSQAGSADVLEALGVRVDLPPEAAAAALRDLGFAFLFAPQYHPAFKHIAPARRLCSERGQRTIFNFLGPLLNPARPTAQLVGVPTPGLCEPVARVLQSLGVQRGMVVCGSVPQSGSATLFLDELSTLGPTELAEFYQARGFAVSQLSCLHFPLQPATLADLQGGDRATNAAVLLALLEGRERGPKRDAILLNAAAALFVADRVKSMDEGWSLAARLIDEGAALAKLQALIAAAR